jgi:hypothetical protein
MSLTISRLRHHGRPGLHADQCNSAANTMPKAIEIGTSFSMVSRCDLNDGQQLDEYRQDLDRCYGYRYRSPGLKCDEGMVSSPTAMLPRIRLRSGRAGLVDELTIY